MNAEKRARFTPDSIYYDLRERICLLDIPPGTTLREQTLAEDYSVSRTPVREALTRLRLDGLVTSQPGGGTSVSTLDLKSLRDVYALRLKLAELIPDFIRVPVPRSVVEVIKAVTVEVEATAGAPDPRHLGKLYNRFHEAMLEVIANETLKKIVDQLFRQTARVWVQLLPDMDWGSEVEIFMDELKSTLEALETGAVRDIAEIRAKHMSMLLSRFNEYLSRPLI